MENKINIAELLKDCPRGMELYSPIFGDVYLDKIRPHLAIVVTTDKEQGDFKEEFLYDGRYGMNGECMLFPSKDKTTWEGFVPPCKFKDGDIIYVKDKYNRSWCSIFYKCEDEKLYTYVDFCITSNNFYCSKPNIVCECSDIIEHRFATEEEKEKLFQVIKDNGYRWDAETKTLEKLTEPKFKDGDVVTYKYENGLVSMILNKFVNFVEVHYHCALYDSAKGFVTNNYIVGEPKYTRLATEEEKEKLFNAIKDSGYKWNPETKTLDELFPYKIGTKVWTKSDKEHKYIHTIVGISSNSFGNLEYEIKEEKTGTVVHYPKDLLIPVAEEKPKFKDGDIVTCKNRNTLIACIYKERKNTAAFYHYIALYKGCLGIVVNGEIVLTIDELCLATEEEKEKLFKAIKDNGYQWNEESKSLEKLPKFKVGDRIKYIYFDRKVAKVVKIHDKRYELDNGKFLEFQDENAYEISCDKFDITTLVPFESKVLVRNVDGDLWKPAIYGFSTSKGCYVVGGVYWSQRIPYEGNEHLLGKTDDCNEYFKTWL